MLVVPLLPRFRFLLCCTTTICLSALIATRPARAQFVSNPQTNVQAPAPKTVGKSDKKPTTEVSLGLLGQFTPLRSLTTVTSYTLINPSVTDTFIGQVQQNTSSSAGVEATFHQQFRRFRGYNINLGYTRFAEKYQSHDLGSVVPSIPGYAPLSDSRSVGTNMYEVGATAVVEGPRTRRFSTSAETGFAVLTFLPTLRPSLPHLQFRPAWAFGAGVNYKLNSYLTARLAYKGLFYANPDFRSGGYLISSPQLLTVTSEPTVSLVYTFGHQHPKLPHLFH